MIIKTFNFEKYVDCIIKIIPLNVAIFLMMTLYRLFFFFYFKNGLALDGLYNSLFKSFLLGARLDIATLAYINLFVAFMFSIFLVIKNLLLFRISVYFLKIYYFLAFSTIIVLDIIDFGFYVSFGEHINILIFDFFSDDTFALIKTILYDHRFLIALISLFIITFIIYKLIAFTTSQLTSKHTIIDTSVFNFISKTLVILLIPFSIFCLARGTLSMFPLGKFHAQVSNNQFINNVALTSVHSFCDALDAKISQIDNYVDIAQKFNVKKEEIDTNIFNKVSSVNSMAEEIKPNVVFIILEGFGELPILYNSQNFDVLGELAKHFQEDFVFYNFLSAGKITVHALESTILNMPQRPFSLQITQTSKAFKQFSSSIVLPYKKANYFTKAIYGGSLAWRDINNFLKAQGFDEVYGEGSIKNEFRHQWGINDAQFFELILRELKNSNGQPMFIYAMSTATHPPYETPPYYKPLNINIPRDILNMMPGETKYGVRIFESYQFANRQAAKFLSEIKSSEFAKNTIVVITGDHNLREFKATTQEELFKKYSVPMYMYVPEKLRKDTDVNISGCHMDIGPTLYDLSFSEAQYTAAGESLLGQHLSHVAFNSDGFILSNNKAVLYNPENANITYFNFNEKTKMLEITQETQEHKEMLEYYKKVVATSNEYLN
ncbi:MAG: sulfatase-like hydrolase/transferase [Endomicrobium sp.]|jgi:phosphoglycerol transferase MdoB-like AlkP superfamily enzyme|nr:sulfatase-like hydrolase/transferase [Endomicrobium sp.]